MTIKLAPAVRFPGFTDVWEQRKLGSIYQFQYGHFNNNPDNGGIYPIYGANGIIGGYHGFNAENSVVIGHMGAYAGHVLWVEGKHFVTYNGTIGFPKDLNFDRKFGFHMLQHINIPKITAGSGQPFVSYSDLENIKLYISDSIDEQNKLGYFFDMLENTIALHQHHLDNHKELKKALLQKMFPRNGEKLPEVRFGGFTEVWEKRKLNKVMSDFIVPMRDKPKEFSGEIPWTRIEDIEGKYLNDSLSGQYVSQAIIEKMNLKVIPKDSLIVSASATFGVVAIVTQDLITNQTFIGLVPEANFDLDFLYTLFQTPTVRTKMKFESAGSTIFYITRQTFENMQFLLPSYEEQQSIGSFFKNIDDTITLLQQKLNDYQRLKKVMLQQMFV